MNDIQIEYLKILKAIHEICQTEGISYMLFGGTLLGSIREKGFIPWDNDADIMMHRKHYIALTKIYKKYFDNYGLVLDCTFRMPKVALMQSPNINVDIVLIDSLPKNKLKRRFLRMEIKILQGMMKDVFDFSKIRITRKPLAVMVWLLGRMIRQESKLELYHKICQKGNLEDSDLFFFSNERYQFLVMDLDKNLLNEVITNPFEGIELNIPKEWDAVLQMYYGKDYMVPKRENYYSNQM